MLNFITDKDLVLFDFCDHYFIDRYNAEEYTSFELDLAKDSFEEDYRRKNFPMFFELLLPELGYVSRGYLAEDDKEEGKYICSRYVQREFHTYSEILIAKLLAKALVPYMGDTLSKIIYISYNHELIKEYNIEDLKLLEMDIKFLKVMQDLLIKKENPIPSLSKCKRCKNSKQCNCDYVSFELEFKGICGF